MPDIRTHAANLYQKSLSEKKFFEIESSGQTAYLNMLLLTAARNRVFIETILRQFIRRPVPQKNIFAFTNSCRMCFCYSVSAEFYRIETARLDSIFYAGDHLLYLHFFLCRIYCFDKN